MRADDRRATPPREMMTMITEMQLNRCGADWKHYAKESIRMETNGCSVIYGFGSELATLRIFKKYHGCKYVRHEYSEARQSWFVSLTVNS